MNPMSEILKMKSARILASAAVAVGVLVGATSAFAFEDDGRPYLEFAKKKEGHGKFAAPTTLNEYNYWAKKTIDDYLDSMDKRASATGNRESVSNQQCSAYHEVYTRDRVIDLRYALGYFDDSRGETIEFAGYDWGMGASSDEGVWIAIREVLKAPCSNGNRRLCGFTELTPEADRARNGLTVLSRQMEVQGRQVDVRFSLTYASASPFYKRNLGALRDKQERFTRTSEENFFEGIRSADYAFYMGHARNGGGPDFNPPRLTSAMKPDYYGYYRKQFPGLNRMLKEVRASGNKDVTLGIFSCDAKLHFHRRLEANNKGQKMILTLGGEGMLHYLDTLMVSLGYIEGLLRGSCGTQLDDFARVTPRERAAYQQYNVK